MKVKIKNATVDDVVKETFWLAWQACGGTLGMGFLQDKPNATKEQVWDNVLCTGDYPGNRSKKNKLYVDYIFGRMMKLGFSCEKDILEFRNDKPIVDYQAWCRVYSTYQKLVEEAAKNVGAEIEYV